MKTIASEQKTSVWALIADTTYPVVLFASDEMLFTLNYKRLGITFLAKPPWHFNPI